LIGRSAKGAIRPAKADKGNSRDSVWMKLWIAFTLGSHKKIALP